jgi:ATP-dependent Zn protease
LEIGDYFLGFSGADISNLCNEAAIFAARADKEFVE